MTRRVYVGGVAIGGGAKVTIQSMTNTDTRDREATLAQIRQLASAGCEIVRVSVYDDACAENVRYLVDNSPVPLVADIHFDYRLAIKSLENGISKLRINPGNIGGEANVRRVADCLKAHSAPVRIGVNSGSIEKELLNKYGLPCPEALVESALNHASLLEKYGFTDIVLSMKASNVSDTVKANRIAARECDYPLHIGVTEAGTRHMGGIKSAIGIGSLLLDGIGDTVRVSLTGDPINEVYAAKDILKAVGLRKEGIDVISCPTCGRTCIPVGEIADKVASEFRDVSMPLTVAVMGCVVNGVGEGSHADIGIAGGKDGGILFRKGKSPVTVRGELAQILIDAVKQELEGK
ncbi:MAG: flavodoxin-dependent (E)-4-hydroxy-3-methylbut-2-enyl-diphosphate synthase [Clostridiales bacterium]|nr:flavodoxin-dependent (E)-4-hydroxy-3-methylbut-2-enyl-diphosphate synthase [Clostridiales bacterium]